MIAATDFVERLAGAGYRLFSGVPCSYLTPLINEAIDSPSSRYVNAANEGDAVAVVAGAWLAGRRGAVLFQNSGFGNAVNPLTSLTHTFGIPMVVIATWRGEPGGKPDEPQHGLMGRITPGLFDLLGIPFATVGPDAVAFGRDFDRLAAVAEATSLPVGLLVRDGAIDGRPTPRTRPDYAADPRLECPPPPRPAGERLDPDDAIAAVRAGAGRDAVIVATTGFTGRALFGLGDAPNQFYMAGSMGCAASLGLGLAVARPDMRVVVIDGDGAALMRLGALAAVGAERPANLVHVVLDNAAHDSTGTQATLSPAVDFAAVAAACGYARSARVGRADELADAVARPDRGPTFLHARTNPRSDRKPPRPDVSPPDVARRLRRWLGER